MEPTTLFLTQFFAVMALVMGFFSFLGWVFKKKRMNTDRLSRTGGFVVFFMAIAGVLTLLFIYFSGR